MSLKNLCASILLLSMFLMYACGDTGSQSATAAGSDLDLSLYTVTSVPGSTWKRVQRNHATGEIFEDGFVNNGKKAGTWTTYFPEDGYIQTITSYENGIFTGPYIEFDERGRLMKQAHYENNELSGLYGEFKNGRVTKKIQYKAGKVNGYIREYNNRSKIIKESNYKNNELDGNVTNYNDEGKVILEYIYKNGQKISGGIVE